MSNKMLIDATHQEETRVVVLRDKRVEDFDFETASRKPLRGNIYLAKVTRVEPSLQAAFIEYGGNRHGFLSFSEIHPDYYQIPQADRQALLAEMEEEEPAEAPRKAPRKRSSSRSKTAKAPATEAIATEAADAAPAAEAAPVEEDAAPAAADETVATEEATAAAPDTAEEPAAEAAATEDDAPASAPAEAAAPEASAEAPAEAAATDEAPAAAQAAEGEAEPAPEKPKRRRRATTTTKAAPKATTKKSDDGLEGDVITEDDDSEADTVTDIGDSDALEEIPERRRRAPKKNYKIQEVIRRRQILLVQVVKEERGTKGAALTTYLSLAGRYSVLMPNTNRGGGVSRKITDNGDRKRLKGLVSELEVPEGMGIILRTAGASRTKTEIKRDFEYLIRLWESVRDLTLRSIAPELVYEEGNLVKRAIRDLYSKEIGEVLVSGEAAYREAKDFMKMLMPSHAKNVKLYREPTPIFTAYGVEAQLDAMFSPTVMLPSKGSIVINPTEALVAIDVNSGKSTKESNIEDTATKTNLEAADEVARQLRLRDLAGLIVIDFIDMDDKRHNRQVEKRLKDALKMDRSRIQVGHISPFGLMEMSRQRIRQGMVETSVVPCPVCSGAGHVRSTQSVALYCLRALEEHLLKKSDHHVTIRTSSSVALYILNQKRAHLNALEERFGLSIGVHADEQLSGQHMEIVNGALVERAPGEAPPVHRFAPDAAYAEDEDEDDIETDAETDDTAAAAEDEDTQRAEDGNGERSSSRRRRRRRRRGGGDGQQASGAQTEAGEDDEPDTADAQAVQADAETDTDNEAQGDADGDADGDDSRRSRRRRGRRGGRRHRREGEMTASENGESEQATDGETGEDTAEAAATEAKPAVEADDVAPAANGADHAVSATEAPEQDDEPAEAQEAAETAEETAAPEAAPEPVAAAEKASEPAPEVKSEPGAKAEQRPRRAGWWQRRSFF